VTKNQRLNRCRDFLNSMWETSTNSCWEISDFITDVFHDDVAYMFFCMYLERNLRLTFF
jgi:hypothetical protein